LRVDEIIWGSFEEWVKFLKTTVKLGMAYLESDEAVLVEIFQRRNTMVHNNGFVHPSYIAKVKPELRLGLEVGKFLDVDPEYLGIAVDTVERSFVLIAAELWKKLDACDEARTETLNNLAIKSLLAGKNEIAAAVSYFVMNDKKLPERSQLVGRLNYWQALKWQDRFEEIRSEVESADFTAKDGLFQLARFVLLEDYSEAVPIAKSLIEADKLPLADLEEWPIFKLFRMQEDIIALIDMRRATESERIKMPDVDEDRAAIAASTPPSQPDSTCD
jgi:hypothetical protein